MNKTKRKNKRNEKAFPNTIEGIENLLYEKAVKGIKGQLRRLKGRRDSILDSLVDKILALFPKDTTYKKSFEEFKFNLCLNYNSLGEDFKKMVAEILKALDMMEKNIKEALKKITYLIENSDIHNEEFPDE